MECRGRQPGLETVKPPPSPGTTFSFLHPIPLRLPQLKNDWMIHNFPGIWCRRERSEGQTRHLEWERRKSNSYPRTVSPKKERKWKPVRLPTFHIPQTFKELKSKPKLIGDTPDKVEDNRQKRGHPKVNSGKFLLERGKWGRQRAHSIPVELGRFGFFFFFL